MEVEHLQVWIDLLVVAVVEKLLVGRANLVKLSVGKLEVHSVEKFLVVCKMALEQFIVGEVDEMPCVIHRILQIRCSFFYRVLVEAVVAGLVDQVDSCFGDIL